MTGPFASHDVAHGRARLFVAAFFVLAFAGYAVYRKTSVADRLVSMDDTLRAEAIADMAGMDDAGRRRLVPGLVRALGNREPGIRYRAAEALGFMGPSAADAVPSLKAKAGDTGLNSDVGAAAAAALVKISPDGGKHLAELLSGGDLEARRNAACALAGLPTPPAEAAAALENAASSDDAVLRDCALKALRSGGGL